MSARFKDVIEADYIGIDICIRMVDGITNTRLSSKVDHDRRLIFIKNLFYEFFVCEVSLYEYVLYR